MKALIILLLGVALGMPFSNLYAEEVTTVTLPPLTVVAQLYTVKVDFKNGVVDRAKICDVTPGTKPFIAGLRDGYALVSIFDQPVIGMKKQKFDALMERLPELRRPKTLRFSRQRGIFRSCRIIDLTFSVSPEKSEPNKTTTANDLHTD